MDEQLHIIVTGDRGKVLRLPCSKKKLSIIATLSAVTFLFLTISSIYAISLFATNRNIAAQLSDLQEKLRTSAELIAEHQRQSEEQKLRLSLKVANLELSNVKQAVAFKEEKETLISTAVGELNERSELIERIMGSIGIEVGENETSSSSNSGGPFIQKQDSEHDELLFRADQYLQAIRYLPFGRPVNGEVTSRFGKRKDPVNKKTAYHTGVDFRAKKGDKVFATADGIVKQAFRNGGYGNYVLIDHENGYTTSFSHLQAFLVRAGDRVERGQLIGLVGNTGRSTGPHLHYEVTLDKKPINPYNFMKVASLDATHTSSTE